jgi:hypothetical protein
VLETTLLQMAGAAPELGGGGMQLANKSAFEDPKERLLALGYNLKPTTTVYLDPSGREQMLVQSGGMISPVRHELRAGTSLYKYTDARQPPDAYLSSGWWFERPELDRVIAFAERNKIPEGYAVRLLGCVPPEWGSNLDLVVRVRLTCDLLAFRGLANSALGKDAKGSTFIEVRNDIAVWRLPQLYVPGLRDPHSGKPTGNHLRWFQREGVWPVRSNYSWIYRATR